MLIYELQEQN